MRGRVARKVRDRINAGAACPRRCDPRGRGYTEGTRFRAWRKLGGKIRHYPPLAMPATGSETVLTAYMAQFDRLVTLRTLERLADFDFQPITFDAVTDPSVCFTCDGRGKLNGKPCPVCVGDDPIRLAEVMGNG